MRRKGAGLLWLEDERSMTDANVRTKLLVILLALTSVYNLMKHCLHHFCVSFSLALLPLASMFHIGT
jgi:hypothetical protein